MNKKEEFQYYVTKFLTSYMAGQRNMSPQTISSYADTFKLLLMYFSTEKNLSADKITLDDISSENIIEFLDWLELNRGVTAATRNNRLSALRSFIKYVQIEDPVHLHEYQKILSVKNKKHQSSEVPYLTVNQIRSILNAPDSSTKQGLRDKTLLTVLYDTGARVSELIQMKVNDIRLTSPACVTIKGKGRKVRTVPLMGSTAELLKKYIQENELDQKQYSTQEYLFVNRSNNGMTRAGVSYIIDKYVSIANQNGANISINVHPHVLRHSKAVHLLEAGIELIYIRDVLGHSSVITTEIYAKVCNTKKREALEKAYEDITDSNQEDWTNDKDLMSLLTSLSKKA